MGEDFCRQNILKTAGQEDCRQWALVRTGSSGGDQKMNKEGWLQVGVGGDLLYRRQRNTSWRQIKSKTATDRASGNTRVKWKTQVYFGSQHNAKKDDKKSSHVLCRYNK